MKNRIFYCEQLDELKIFNAPYTVSFYGYEDGVIVYRWDYIGELNG
jgi:hypothetical protein